MSRAFLVVVIVSLCGAVAGRLQGQSTGAQLTVETTDPTGAVMQASGSLQSNAGGQERRFRTDQRGLSVLSDLAPGEYSLHVTEPGFMQETVAVSLQAGSRTRQVVSLALNAQATRVQVVGTTPLSADNGALSELSRPVQTVDQVDVANSGALNLADLLNKRLTSVFVNETQGNPFQPDVNYRGYTASPLLGTPQGLSIYMDGVRLNQPFGDVVSWDLIPKVAIAETTLIPGSDPLFGLNTLGGALSIRTKDGISNPGTSVELSGGSFGRKAVQVEHGGYLGQSVAYYVAANLFFEDGWRTASPSDVQQFFGKVNWVRERTNIGLSVAYANNSLTGNGLQDQRLLALDYASYYTKPDITNNRSPFINLTARHSVSSALTLSGNAYYRNLGTRTLNGDLNDNSLDQSLYQLSAADQRALRAAGYSGFSITGNPTNTPFPKWRCIAQSLENDEPAEKCNAIVNTTVSSQRNFGLFGQATWTKTVAGRRNQLVVGGGYDGNNTGFTQNSQLGYLNPDRSITVVNSFGDGVNGGTVDDLPFDTRVNLGSTVHTGSVYFGDTLQVLPQLTLNFSGRYNRSSVTNRDRIIAAGAPGSLSGQSVYERFNPSVGLSYAPLRFLGAYASYSESSRAPTSIELGCADPELPCKLPNAFAGDPPLDQVITRTWEAGLRGGLEGSGFGWSAGWFRADNRNDLLFVSSAQTGFGYFRNFGRTLRQGAEVSVRSRMKRLTLGGGYTFLDATYQSAETLNGSSNSTNAEAEEGTPGVDGTIDIRPGNQIPLTPRHMVKAYADIQVTARLSLSLNEIAVAKSFARGNENNLSAVSLPYYLGPGYSPGYAVLNAGARYRATRWAEAFVQVNNLLDRRYYTAALLGSSGFTQSATFIARPFPAIGGEFPLQHASFYAPGAPIGVWGGLRFHF